MAHQVGQGHGGEQGVLHGGSDPGQRGAPAEHHHPLGRRSRSVRSQRLRCRAHLDAEHRSDRQRRRGLRRGLRHRAHLRARSRRPDDRPCPEPLRLRDTGDGVLSEQLRRVHLGTLARRHRRVQGQGKALVPVRLAGAQARRAAIRDHALGDSQEVPLQHRPHRQVAPRHPSRAGADGPWLRLPVRLLRRILTLLAQEELVRHHQPRAHIVQRPAPMENRARRPVCHHAEPGRDLRGRVPHLRVPRRDQQVHGGAQGRALLHLRRVLRAPRALPGACSSTTASTPMSKTRTSASTTR